MYLDHIDNPKNYADNEDARQYDRRLRGPIDESVELAIDEETGMKNYIANERLDIMTSALHVRRLFTKCIELGRRYSQSERKEDLYEALRLMGTGLHCLEGKSRTVQTWRGGGMEDKPKVNARRANNLLRLFGS